MSASLSTKTLLGIAAVVLIALGGFLYMNHTANAPVSENGDTTTLPSGERTDDAALSQDLGSIDTQLTASNNDVNEAGASVDAAAD